MKPAYRILSLASTLALASFSSNAMELRGNIAAQYRGFFEEGAFPNQHQQHQGSISVEPELYWEWNDGIDSITFTPFARADSMDSERSHADIRELKWLHLADEFELEIGIAKVFWGVTETQHLVDVINQTDFIESPDGDEKLGQTMLHFNTYQDSGIWDIFILPGFRERTFAGVDGRFRPPLPVDQDNAKYESGAGNKHVDVAARWAQTFGDWDVGTAYFRGTNRDPLLIPSQNGTQLTPYYEQMDQLGVDLQATLGDWLWKFEGLYRNTSSNSYSAAVGGYEYTLVGLFNSSADLGLLTEYNWNSDGKEATSTFQNDLYLGARWVLNDAQSTEFLLGGAIDLDYDTNVVTLEASRRFGENWKGELDLWYIDADDLADPTYAFSKDSFVQVNMAYFF
ncbi:hypothetical protein M0C34_05215 [Agarivorans sp. TSD2052]|uniref:hypothetical protein n=1 Tax=Agarivorans sp. TSD2052 TaxID=2937286 RepID=UPI00201049AF|nr:hypothetical protein [Agarivorans sp. TSD2052]UPW19682.1 hypothetical protein M0C34_05215 [Agarivorans sp. TSD2052]